MNIFPPHTQVALFSLQHLYEVGQILNLFNCVCLLVFFISVLNVYNILIFNIL